MTSTSPSLRQIARGLGVSHTLLSLWRQGKRSIRPDLEEKYWAFVTNNGYTSGYKPDARISRNIQVELGKYGAEGGSRTHTGVTPMDFESIASAIPPLRLVGCSSIWPAGRLERCGLIRAAGYLY